MPTAARLGGAGSGADIVAVLAERRGISYNLRVLSATLVRKRSISVLVIAATGKNVLRVMTAFERHNLVVARADDLTNAFDLIVRDLPYVVLSLATSETPAETRKLDAVGKATNAAVVRLDPNADDATFKGILDGAVGTALEKSGMPAVSADDVPSAPPPAAKDVDEGWDKS